MTSLTLAQLAEITLRLERGEPRDAVLAHLGISEESWLRGQAEWFSLMSTQAQRQRHVLFQRYLAARAAAERRLEEAAKPDRGQAAAKQLERSNGKPGAPPQAQPRGEVPALPPAPLYAMTNAPLRAAAASLSPAMTTGPRTPVAPASFAMPSWQPPPNPVPASPAFIPPPAEPAHIPPPAEPQLAVQQLAGLVAELTVFPERAAAALADVGLDQLGWDTEWAAWQNRFAMAPEQRREYESLVGYYSGLFRSRPR